MRIRPDADEFEPVFVEAAARKPAGAAAAPRPAVLEGRLKRQYHGVRGRLVLSAVDDFHAVGEPLDLQEDAFAQAHLPAVRSAGRDRESGHRPRQVPGQG